MCNTEDSRCSDEFNGYCMNGGICCHSQFITDPFCICGVEWTGVRCQKRRQSLDLFSDQVFGEMTIIILAVAIIIVCIVVAVIFFRRNDWQTRSRSTCRLLRTGLTFGELNAPRVLPRPDAVRQCETIDISDRLLSTDTSVTSSLPSSSPFVDDVSVSCVVDAGPP